MDSRSILDTEDNNRSATSSRPHVPAHVTPGTAVPGSSYESAIDLSSSPSASPASTHPGSLDRRRSSRSQDNQYVEHNRPLWQPDTDVTECPICGTVFSFWYRKHHCRKCGRVVCSACSPHRITIPRQYIVHAPDTERSGASALAQRASQIVNLEGDNQAPSPVAMNPALGGGEEVRLCNPCVPDPNPEPPLGYPPVRPEIGSGSNWARHRSYHSLSAPRQHPYSAIVSPPERQSMVVTDLYSPSLSCLDHLAEPSGRPIIQASLDSVVQRTLRHCLAARSITPRRAHKYRRMPRGILFRSLELRLMLLPPSRPAADRAAHTGQPDKSMNVISVQSVIMSYRHSAQMGAKMRAKHISASVSPATAERLAGAQSPKIQFLSECLHSRQPRRTVSDRMAQNRNVPSAWKNTRSGSRWFGSSACASSTRGALSSGLSGGKSVQCIRHHERYCLLLHAST